MKKYRHTITIRFSLENEAESLHDAEEDAFNTLFGFWDWQETVYELVQQQNPDGSWGPVTDEEESDFRTP